MLPNIAAINSMEEEANALLAELEQEEQLQFNDREKTPPENNHREMKLLTPKSSHRELRLPTPQSQLQLPTPKTSHREMPPIEPSSVAPSHYMEPHEAPEAFQHENPEEEEKVPAQQIVRTEPTGKR